MKWNRKKLLAVLASQGFKAEGASLDTVKAFVAEKALDIADGEGSLDVDAAWKNEADEATEPVTKTRVVYQEPTDYAQLRKDAELGRKARADAEVKRLPGVSDVKVGQFARCHGTDAQIKSYNAKKYGVGGRAFADAEQAILFGVWSKSVLTPRLLTDDDKALLTKANIGTTNTTGGALIPEEFTPQLIDLKAERGVGRTVLPPIPMRSDTLKYPRRTGGLTAYFPGEAGTITESNPTVNNVNLVAAKMATLTHVSNELMHDAALSMGDFVAREIAYAFADKEDEIIFNGGGSATHGHMTGLCPALLALSATRANIAGLFVASGNLFSEYEITDFNTAISRLPSYVKSPKWYMHKTFFEIVCGRIAERPGASGAAAGATVSELAQYRMSGNPTWLGYQVVFVDVMQRVDANDTVSCLFGEPSMAAKTGLVGGSMEIATSTDFGFNLDVTSIRGIQRFACAVHDVGNADSTASLRVPGPVVGLLSAAS